MNHTYNFSFLYNTSATGYFPLMGFATVQAKTLRLAMVGLAKRNPEPFALQQLLSVTIQKDGSYYAPHNISEYDVCNLY